LKEGEWSPQFCKFIEKTLEVLIVVDIVVVVAVVIVVVVTVE
jgi:hypothetical protein